MLTSEGFCLSAGADVQCDGRFGLFDSVSLAGCLCCSWAEAAELFFFFFVLQVFMGLLNKPGFSVSVPTVVVALVF